MVVMQDSEGGNYMYKGRGFISKAAIFDGKVVLENVDGMPPKIYATFPCRYSLKIYQNS